MERNTKKIKRKCKPKIRRKKEIRSPQHKVKEFSLQNANKNEQKHIAMPAKTVTITQGDDFTVDDIKSDDGTLTQTSINISSEVLTDTIFDTNAKAPHPSKDDTPILINFTNKTFPSLLNGKSIIGSGLQTFLNFLSEDQKNENTQIQSHKVTQTIKAHDTLEESENLLKTTADIFPESSTITNIDNRSKFSFDHDKITYILSESGINLTSLKNFIQHKENIQEQKLNNLRDQLLQVPNIKSDLSTSHPDTSVQHATKKSIHNSVPPFTQSKTQTKEIYDDDSSSSSSSSSTSSDDAQDLSETLRKILKIGKRDKTLKASSKNDMSNKSFAKKAISLETKMIKNASRVQFHKLKLDNDPRTTRLLFMYFIEDLTKLLDLFTETHTIIINYPEINEPKQKHNYASKSLFTFINAYSNSEVKRTIKITYGDGCKALRLLQA